MLMTDRRLRRRTRRIWRSVSGIRRQHYEWRLRASGWYDPSARSEHHPVIIGGCGRSGTTVLREMLNRHPGIFCGPETSMFGLPFWPGHIAPYWDLDEAELRRRAADHENLVRFAEDFFRGYASREGKGRWCDKTPNNVRAIEKILTWFPRARFIHMLRDGRDVACSLRHHPKEKVVKGKLVSVRTDNPISACARRWFHDTSKGLAFRGHPRCLEVRYETLVRDPEKEARRICDFLQEDFSPRMLEHGEADPDPLQRGRLVNNRSASRGISDTSVGRWMSDLSPQEKEQFANVAGELLAAAGYVSGESWLHSQGAPWMSAMSSSVFGRRGADYRPG